MAEWTRPGVLTLIDHIFVSGPGVVHQDIDTSLLLDDAVKCAVNLLILALRSLFFRWWTGILAEGGKPQAAFISRPTLIRTEHVLGLSREEVESAYSPGQSRYRSSLHRSPELLRATDSSLHLTRRFPATAARQKLGDDSETLAWLCLHGKGRAVRLSASSRARRVRHDQKPQDR